MTNISHNFSELNNISGLQEIDDSVAESLSGGGFRFAASVIGSNTARVVDTTTAVTGRYPAQINDANVRLTDTDGVGNRFAIAIHNRDTGANVAQIRGENNPARSGDLINVGSAFDNLPGFGNYEYRVRQIVDTTAPSQTPDPLDRFRNGSCDGDDLLSQFNQQTGNCSSIQILSDRRLKNDIQELGLLEELGIKIYSWKYRHGDSTRYVGVMAQDLLTRPDLSHAVVTVEEGEFAGFYAVNYETLGITMATEAEWLEKGMAAVMNQQLAVCA